MSAPRTSAAVPSDSVSLQPDDPLDDLADEFDVVDWIASSAPGLGRVTDVARCLGSTGSAMGWQNEIDPRRFAESAILDRICLEFTVRGFVPKVEIERGDQVIPCTYQGRGVWRVHEDVYDGEGKGGETTRYETGTQHFLDFVPGGFPEALAALRSYAGRIASDRLERLREDTDLMERRLAKL